MISLTRTPEGLALIKNISKLVPTINKEDVVSDYSEFFLDKINLAEGKGEITAECGQKVEIYDIKNKENIKFYIGDEGENFTYSLGVIGMKIGSERKIILKDGTIKHFILKNIENKKLPFVYNSDLIQISRISTLCGQEITAKYRIYDADRGNLIFDHDSLKLPPTKIKLNRKIPYGILKSVVGMSLGGTRTILITPENIRDIDGKKVINFFPKDINILPYKNYIVEIDQKLTYVY